VVQLLGKTVAAFQSFGETPDTTARTDQPLAVVIVENHRLVILCRYPLSDMDGLIADIRALQAVRYHAAIMRAVYCCHLVLFYLLFRRLSTRWMAFTASRYVP
jgi:hypothetical protein